MTSNNANLTLHSSSSSLSSAASSSTSASSSAFDSLPATIESNPTTSTHINDQDAEQPVCRVCRSDDPSLGPLFHPCRCTGSIAHVHQDCLSTWLSHSKKSSCELCAHPFSFEKVYKSGSPDRPPIPTIIFQALKEFLRLILLIGRATLVAMCWLGLVPWTVVWVSAAYWRLGDWFAFGLTSGNDLKYKRTANQTSGTLNSTESTDLQLALNSSDSNSTNLKNMHNSFNLLSIHLDTNSIAMDIFQGQLITCAVILSFVAVFLLREWILQNTPPHDVMHLEEDDAPQNPPRPQAEGINNNRQARIENVEEQPDSNDILDRIIAPTPRPPINSTEENSLTSSDSDSSDVIFHQFSTGSDLHDDSDLMDSHNPDQSLNTDILSHQVLITSVYIIFIAEPATHQFKFPSHQSGSTTPMRSQLIQTWTKLASTLMDPSTGTLPLSVTRLREHMRRQPTSGPFLKDEETVFNRLETDWTTALLSDPKIAKHIQSLYRIKLDGNKSTSPNVFHHHALVYGLLTLFSLIKGLELVDEGDHHPHEETSRPYLTVFNALKLFVVPLLGAMGSIDMHPSLNQLEVDIQKLAETYQVLPSGEVGDDSMKLITDMKQDLVSMLVKQRILGAVVGSGSFVKYAQDILCKQNLLSKESSVLQTSKLVSASGDPDDKSRSMVAPTRNPFTVTPPLPPSSFNPEMSDLLLPTSVNHRLLVTSAYLLLLPPSYNTLLPPAVQTMNMLHKFPMGWKDEKTTGLWSKFATSMILSDETKSELKGFRQYVSRVSKFSSSALARSFQRLEVEWLAMFLNDEVIISFASAIYESEGNKLILQLIKTYDKLKYSLEPNIAQYQISYESLHAALHRAVELKLEECSSAQLQKGVFEVVRSTQFLLESCKALPHPTSSADQSPIIRSIERVARMRRGILGILARHQLLYRIVKHEGFGRYATAMLMNEDLLGFDDIGMTLKVLPSDESGVVDNNPNKGQDVKGKRKETEALVAEPSSGPTSSAPLHITTSHTDAFNWLEVGEELPKANESNPTRPQPTTGPGTPHPMVDRVVRPIPPRNQPRRFMLPPPVGNRVQQAPVPPLQVAPVLDRRHLAMMQARLNEFDQAQNLDRNNRLPANDVGPGDLAAVAAAAVPDDEVEEELLAEDLDGILELIGMKGSLLMLVQNVGLMTLLLSLSILAFVHIPHMIGKIAVLSRAHRLLAPPLKGLLILRRFVHLSLDYVSVHLKRQLTQIHFHSRFSLSRFMPMIKNNNDPVQVIPWTPSWLTHNITGYFQAGVHYLQSQFNRIIGLSPIWHQLIDQLGERLEQIAYGTKPLDRALAVLLGYTELVFLSLIYLSSGLDQQRARFVSETIVNGMRQQVMITKVGTFIFIELVIFPFLCGFLINLTTIPVFPNTTISNRLELYSVSPYSTVLITWLAGTCFMFTFAILVSTCRESLRSGVCWWIRDPSDDRFNPIREILERPAWSQVKKILASALMYGSVIALGIGSIVMSLMAFTGCLPLRVHLDRSISSSAIDLVIYQTGLPLFIYWIQPRTQLKQSLQIISKKVAKKFRLSCFLYGEREIEEETTLEVVIRMPGREPILKKPRAWYSFMRYFEDDQQYGNSDQIESLEEIQPGTTIERRRKSAGGSFARVPGTDSVKVVPGRKMHIPVLANGTPINPADEVLITQQKAEARAETGREVDHYTVVYLPPFFRIRMIGYVVSMWSIGVMFGWIGIGIPLMMGRLLLDRVFMVHSREPHDVYAYAVGSLVVAIIGRLVKKIIPFNRNEETEVVEVKEKIQWLKKIVRMINLIGFIIGVGMVLPILSTGLIELYILGPLKPKGLGIPTIYLVQTWAYGAIYLSIAARLIRVVPNWVSRAQDEVMACWNRGEILEGIQIANLKIILPITIKMILAISLPTGILGPILLIIPERNLKFLMRLIGWGDESIKKGECIYLMLRSVYPAILSWYSHYLTSRICAKGIGKWIEKVRDEKFLEERRLKNYDAENDEENRGKGLKKKKKKDDSKKKSSDQEAIVMNE